MNNSILSILSMGMSLIDLQIKCVCNMLNKLSWYCKEEWIFFLLLINLVN